MLNFATAVLIAITFLAPFPSRLDNTRVDLYRIGNASGPRMTHVRETDVETYQKDGETWVKGRSGGVSTFAAPQNRSNEWLLKSGAWYTSDLYLNNNSGNHWQWEPAYDMPLKKYISILGDLDNKFERYK